MLGIHLSNLARDGLAESARGAPPAIPAPGARREMLYWADPARAALVDMADVWPAPARRLTGEGESRGASNAALTAAGVLSRARRARCALLPRRGACARAAAAVGLGAR
jgi:hypothetical protein